MGNNELLSKCQELRELRNMAAELDNQIDALEDAVKQEMQQRGVDKLFIGDCHVSWLEYTTTRFDTRKFKAEHSGLYAAFSKSVKAKRFSIS